MVFECGTTNNNNNMSLFIEVPCLTAATKPRPDDAYDNSNNNNNSNSRARKSHNAQSYDGTEWLDRSRGKKGKKTKKGTGKPKTKSDFLHVNTTAQPGNAVEAWSQAVW